MVRCDTIAGRMLVKEKGGHRTPRIVQNTAARVVSPGDSPPLGQLPVIVSHTPGENQQSLFLQAFAAFRSMEKGTEIAPSVKR
jgi:hypothetical protein